MRFTLPTTCYRQAWKPAGLDRNTENAALSQDIQKVLRGIEEAKQPAAGSEPPSTPDLGDGAAHILLSNYGKFGGTVH